MLKRIREMKNSELIDELIKTSELLGIWSMETYNPGSLNIREEKRYGNLKKKILDRMVK